MLIVVSHFGDFSSHYFNFIQSSVAKRILEMNGPNSCVVNRGLVFGYQSNFLSLAGNATAEAVLNVLSTGRKGLVNECIHLVALNSCYCIGNLLQCLSLLVLLT